MIYNNVAEIYEMLDKARTKLMAKSETFTAEQLNARENEQGWSVAEILEHLGIVEGGVIKITEKLLSNAESDGVKSDGNFNPPVSFLEQAKAAKDTKFTAPAQVHPNGAQDLSTSLKRLEENRLKLNDLRSRIESTDSSNTAFPHPAFGNINLYQWLVMIGLHEQRHLAQIDRILAQTNS